MNYLKSILLFIIIIISGCGTGNEVTIENFYPSGEVKNLATFKVEFSQDLAPSDMLDKWLEDEFITFEPAIQGKFKWITASELIFSPDFPLEPIQKYTAKINKNVLFNTEFSSDFEDYEFHTPYFDAEKADFFWVNVPYEDYKITVQANLHFNYPVDPSQLKEFITIERDNNIVNDFEIVSDQNANIIAMNFGKIQQTEKEQDLKITVKKGLYSVLGKEGLTDERVFNFKLPPITRLAITGTAAGFDGENGWIEISTTQMVDEKKIEHYLSLNTKTRKEFYVSDNLIRIEGDFNDLEEVELKIKKGLPGLYGGILEDDFEQIISLVNLEPSINFADRKGKYLMLSGQKNIQVNTVNIPAVDIEVSQVFKNNLVLFLNQNSYYYDEYYDYYNPSYYVGNFGKTIYSEKKRISSNSNWLEKFNVNISKALNQRFKGIYVLRVSSDEDRWISDSKMIAVTDLGIIAKRSKNQISVFINSIASTEPKADVEISLISNNNQILGSMKTDESGVVKFENVSELIGDFSLRAITAELEDDFNYLDLNESFIDKSRFDVGGTTEFSNYYSSYIYGDRTLYRPGDKVNITGIIREKITKVVKKIPLIIKIISPTGKVFDEFKQTLNEQGSFEISFTLPDYSQTGSYRCELYDGNDQLIGNYNFSVEEFVPDKIRIDIKVSKAKAVPGDNVSIDLGAEFLYGAPASGLKFESDIQLRHKNFYSSKYKDYDFSSTSIENSFVQNEIKESKLDDNGKGLIDYSVPSGIESKGILNGLVFVSVFDLTGRPVNRAVSFDIYPKNYFIGVKSPGYYFGINEKLNFKTIALDKDENPLNNFKTKVELIRFEWQTVLKKDYNDRYYYSSEKKEIKEWERKLTYSGVTDIGFSTSKSGEYELRIYKDGDEDYVFSTFYAYGWAGTTATSFEVDKEGRIEIITDKETYEPGEKAKILFKTPFSGKLLLTIERSNILYHTYIDIKNKSAEFELPIMEEYLPNIYVSATLFRKHSSDDTAPFLVGHGYASIKVDKKDNVLPLSIKAPKKIKPNSSHQITIKTKPQKNIFITLAAVDEGILQIKNYVTPDPYRYFYSKRALEVDGFDIYKFLLPEILSQNSSTGGDQMAQELRKRTNPITSKRFNLVSYWSGIKKSDSNGEVRITLNVPQFNGDLRLMAVAYFDQRYGSSEEHIKVADDLIIEPEIPRFLSVNDSLTSTISIINTTSASQKVDVEVEVKGPLTLASKKNQSITIPANSTSKAYYKINSSSGSGVGKIIIRAKGNVTVKDEIAIAVRPISPYITEAGNGILKAGENKKLSLPKDYLKGTQSTTLTISKFPAIQFAKYLKNLIGYPHGCVEQTVSKLFPQIYFEDLAKLIAPDVYRTNSPSYYVKEGIRKLESMQLYDGSLAYWQGGNYTNWWGSVYAAHFFVESKKAGFAVSERVLNNLLNYIAGRAREHSTYDYTTYNNNSRTVKKIANKEILYSLYVLALAGKGDIAGMNYYKARPHLLTGDTQYLLAASYALMGKWNSYHQLLPKRFDPEKTDRLTGGSFDSEIRSNAIKLNVLLEVEPYNTQIPFIIKYLMQNSDKIYSTQEKSFVFLALGKSAKKTSESNVTVDVIRNGKNIGVFQGNDLVISDINGANLELQTKGTGEVYYFWSSQGVKTTERIAEEDSFMKVRREYYDYRSGRKILDNSFTQGQLVLCKIILEGQGQSAENIVITDMLPAGFEIENPRLFESRINEENSNRIIPDYLDLRDDRIIIFTNLVANSSREFTYVSRVINKGKFRLPPIYAEAMYNDQYRSINGAGFVTIKE